MHEFAAQYSLGHGTIHNARSNAFWVWDKNSEKNIYNSKQITKSKNKAGTVASHQIFACDDESYLQALMQHNRGQQQLEHPKKCCWYLEALLKKLAQEKNSNIHSKSTRIVELSSRCWDDAVSVLDNGEKKIQSTGQHCHPKIKPYFEIIGMIDGITKEKISQTSYDKDSIYSADSTFLSTKNEKNSPEKCVSVKEDATIKNIQVFDRVVTKRKASEVTSHIDCLISSKGEPYVNLKERNLDYSQSEMNKKPRIKFEKSLINYDEDIKNSSASESLKLKQRLCLTSAKQYTKRDGSSLWTSRKRTKVISDRQITPTIKKQMNSANESQDNTLSSHYRQCISRSEPSRSHHMLQFTSMYESVFDSLKFSRILINRSDTSIERTRSSRHKEDNKVYPTSNSALIMNAAVRNKIERNRLRALERKKAAALKKQCMQIVGYQRNKYLKDLRFEKDIIVEIKNRVRSIKIPPPFYDEVCYRETNYHFMLR